MMPMANRPTAIDATTSSERTRLPHRSDNTFCQRGLVIILQTYKSRSRSIDKINEDGTNRCVRQLGRMSVTYTSWTVNRAQHVCVIAAIIWIGEQIEEIEGKQVGVAAQVFGRFRPVGESAGPSGII